MAESTKTQSTNKDEPQIQAVVVDREKSDPAGRRVRLNDLQEMEGNFLRAVRRVTTAMDSGVNAYMDARERSIDEKGEQAFADTFVNMAVGMSKTIEEIAPLPVDLINTFYPETARRFVEDGVDLVNRTMDMRFNSDDDDDDEDDDDKK